MQAAEALLGVKLLARLAAVRLPGISDLVQECSIPGVFVPDSDASFAQNLQRDQFGESCGLSMRASKAITGFAQAVSLSSKFGSSRSMSGVQASRRRLRYPSACSESVRLCLRAIRPKALGPAYRE